MKPPTTTNTPFHSPKLPPRACCPGRGQMTSSLQVIGSAPRRGNHSPARTHGASRSCAQPRRCVVLLLPLSYNPDMTHFSIFLHDWSDSSLMRCRGWSSADVMYGLAKPQDQTVRQSLHTHTHNMSYLLSSDTEAVPSQPYAQDCDMSRCCFCF